MSDRSPQEINETRAKDAHEARYKAALSAAPLVITFAVEALKSAVLINGGTAGALLAFVGQKGIASQPGLPEAFIWFAGGLLSAAVATAFAYFAQFAYGIEIRCYTVSYERPYVRDTPASGRWKWVGGIFHVIGVIAVAVSYGAAVRGFYVAWMHLQL